MKKLKSKIIQYFKPHDTVNAVYLFGSAAKGTFRDSSDIDLAVLFVPRQLNKFERFDFLLTSSMGLEKILGRPVDVLDISNIPLILQHQVLKTGEILCEINRKERINFEVNSRRQYFDMLPLYQARNNNLLQRFRG